MVAPVCLLGVHALRRQWPWTDSLLRAVPRCRAIPAPPVAGASAAHASVGPSITTFPKAPLRSRSNAPGASAKGNTLSLGLRDTGTMNFVKWLNCSAPESRVDFYTIFTFEHDDNSEDEEEDDKKKI